MPHFVDQHDERRLIQRVAESQMKLPSLAGLDPAPEFPFGGEEEGDDPPSIGLIPTPI
jgi:hypothetical protein